MRVAWAGKKRLGEPAAPFQLTRRKTAQLGDAEALEKLGPQPLLHVGDHGLQRFLADFRPMAGLIAHAAGLAAHAQGAGLASIARPQRLPKLKHADAPGHPQGVFDCGPSTAAAEAFHTGSPVRIA